MNESHSGQPLRGLSPEAAGAILAAQGHLRMVPNLTLGLLHRLNNIMTSVSFTLEAIDFEIPPESVAKELMTDLATAIRDAQAIVRRTAEVNLFLGSEEAEYQDLNSTVRSDHDLLRILLPKGADLRIESFPEGLVVRASVSNLRRILFPIFANASDHGADDCRVTVRCIPADQLNPSDYVPDGPWPSPGAAILVRDSGRVDAQKASSAITSPFESTEGGHAGLGLFSAGQVARDLGGCLKVNRTTAVGAEFLVVLPRILE